MNTDTLVQAAAQSGVALSRYSLHWTRFGKSLNGQDLFGENADPEVIRQFDTFFSGRKNLLASEKDSLKVFASLEAEKANIMRQLPDLLGVKYVPNGKLAEVRAKFASITSRFFEARDEWMPMYTPRRVNGIRLWREYATASGLPESLGNIIEAAFPSEDRVRASFRVEGPYFFSVNLVAGDMQTNLVDEAKAQEAAAARQEASAQAASEVRDQIIECGRQTLNILTQGVVEVSKQMKETIIGSEKGVNQKTLNRLHSLYDHIVSMDYIGHAQLRELVEAARNDICGHTAEEYRNNAGWTSELLENITAMGEAASVLAQQDTTELVNAWATGGGRKIITD